MTDLVGVEWDQLHLFVSVFNGLCKSESECVEVVSWKWLCCKCLCYGIVLRCGVENEMYFGT
jgi:hypothetical protein